MMKPNRHVFPNKTINWLAGILLLCLLLLGSACTPAGEKEAPGINPEEEAFQESQKNKTDQSDVIDEETLNAEEKADKIREAGQNALQDLEDAFEE